MARMTNTISSAWTMVRSNVQAFTILAAAGSCAGVWSGALITVS